MQDEPCPFCEFAKLSGISQRINDSSAFMVMWKPFPVGIGHVKIMPKRHDATIENLSDLEWLDFGKTLRKTMAYLDTSLKHKPDGYNVGLNWGEAAGQTIAHLHWHLIPRYTDDMENPRGGVRNIYKPSFLFVVNFFILDTMGIEHYQRMTQACMDNHVCNTDSSPAAHVLLKRQPKRLPLFLCLCSMTLFIPFAIMDL